MVQLGPDSPLDLSDFYHVVFKSQKVTLSEKCLVRLSLTRAFIDHLLEENIKVYGLTTGFADLRNLSVDPQLARELSENIIKSHDAGIGPTLDHDVVLGAMLVRAASLSKGYSGFKVESLKTLVHMINAKVVPFIPNTGSLGASGDLAFLARLGRAMQGDPVKVWHKGAQTTADKALKEEGISPFIPTAKEGLALTNGTSFMASMISIAYIRQLSEFENMLAAFSLFFNAVRAVSTPFVQCIQEVRQQSGQKEVARLLLNLMEDSPFVDWSRVQDDYCIRCLPQILGPKLEIMRAQLTKINAELDAVTDNPLLFCNQEISADVPQSSRIDFDGNTWAVLSGGNFHGEYVTHIADTLCAVNSKIAYTLERQLTYMLNPFRNKGTLPTYLLHNEEKAGLYSGYMLTQYTANALTQRIAQMSTPSAMFNMTSANESEDVVSYGATAAFNLLHQLDLMHQLNTIYLTTASQAYSIARGYKAGEGVSLSDSLISERVFALVKEYAGEDSYPSSRDESFEVRYGNSSQLLGSSRLGKVLGLPLTDTWLRRSPGE